ncbi:MAG: YdcH family protein [Myxococcota bacterium]
MALSPDSVPSDIDTEIARLQQVHRELKARLSELNSRLYLSPDEEVERKRLQKLKLATKDQIVRLRSSP